MGAKTRSNYAPAYSLTDEDFNRIFGKEKDADTKSTEQKEREREDSNGSMGEETKALPAQKAE